MKSNQSTRHSSCVFFALLIAGLAILSLTPTAEAQTVVSTQTYAYDTGTNGIGRLSSVTEADGSGTTTGTTSFSYDVRGRTIQTSKMVGGTTYTVQSTYDSLNRPSDLTYPDNEVVHHTYNSQGLLSRLRSTTLAVDYVSSLHYNALGQLTSSSLGNGKSTTYTYADAQNACPRNNNFRLCAMATTGLQGLTYAYDDNGNISNITDTVGVSTQSFTYDNLNRLYTAASNVAPTYSHSYNYNAIGNMMSAAGQTFAYRPVGSPQPHAPTSDGTSSYFYDANGDMLTKTTGATVRTFTWDVDNRLSQVKDGSTVVASFAYDYSGNRVKKTVGANTTVYIGKLYECTPSTCNKYYFAGGQRIASRNLAGALTFYHADHLGSSNVMTDAAGVLQQRLDYFPYGLTRANSIAPSSGARYKFTGQELDDDSTGLYFYNARYYDSALMKFISPDNFAGGPVNLSQIAIQQTSASLPNSGGDLGDLISPAALPPSFSGFAGDLSNPQTLNRYAYVYNNPLRYTDPTGEEVIMGGHVAASPLGYITSPDSLHLAFILIPDNPEDFKGNPLFKSLPGHGLAATLGAQPNVGYFPPSLGNLTFRPNYPGDLPGGKVENLPFRRTIETPEGLTDTQFINNLIKAATSYKNNLSYDPLPVPGVEGFNSNSFFAGVLMGATGHFPSLDIGPVYQAPGYYEPIPLDPLSK